MREHRLDTAAADSGPTLSQPEVNRLGRPHPDGEYDEVDRWPNGNVCYLLNGELHRVDGPAFVGADGSATWLQHGMEHRLDGPAVCGPDGEIEFWVRGHQVDAAPIHSSDH